MEQAHRVTVNHEEVRGWAERNGGTPQVIDDPAAGSDKVGIRIDFPGRGDDTYLADSSHARPITWAEFFELFERHELLFVYQEDADPRSVADSYRFEPRRSS
jgi:hypothetical protein